MPKKTQKGNATIGSTELSSLGGKRCLKKHGRAFYQRIAALRWSKDARSAKKKLPAKSKPKR